MDSEQSPFLDASPAPWAARGAAWLLIGVFAAVAVAAVFVQVPETVSSRFVLLSTQGADQVRATRDGVVAEVRRAEAERFGHGEALFVIRSSQVGDRAAEMTTLEAQLQGMAARLANERQRYESQRRADEDEEGRLQGRLAHLGQRINEQHLLRESRQARYRATLAIYDNELDIAKREIDFRKQQFGIAKELAERTERLHAQGIISWLEYTNRQLEASKLETDLQQLEKQIENIRLKVSQITSEEQRHEIEWRLNLDELTTERRAVSAAIDKLGHEMAARRSAHDETERAVREEGEKARIRTVALSQDLEKSRGNEQIVPAPCAGVVLRLLVRRPGTVLKEGEPLSELACDGPGLRVELTVPASGAGQIKPGQRVKLLYDSFPYQRFGVRHATVRWVSPSAVAGEVRAFAELDEATIVVKGERRPLGAGMGGRAQVIVGRRALIAYAFEPLRQLKESLADAPPQR